MDNFYVQIKEEDTRKVIKELGPMSGHKAEKVAAGIDINLSDDFYTEIIEKH